MTDKEIMDVAEKRVGVLRALTLHALIYASINMFLTLINLFYTPGYIWVLWVTFVWGMGLSVHGAVGYVMVTMSRTRVLKEFRNIKEREI